MVDLGGHEMYLECHGEGSPTVIIEDASGEGSSTTFWESIDTIAAETRVCVYDRAGLGLSDPWPDQPRPLTAGELAVELHTMLEAASEPGPYVVVGHSFAGILARVFAGMYTQEVAGTVLVDPMFLSYYDAATPHMRFGADHVNVRQTERDLSPTGHRDRRPLIVLSALPAGQEAAMFADRAREAAVSSNSQVVYALDSGHMIHQDQPDLFVEALTDVITSARTGTTLASCERTFPDLGGACSPQEALDTLYPHPSPMEGSWTTGVYPCARRHDAALAAGFTGAEWRIAEHHYRLCNIRGGSDEQVIGLREGTFATMGQDPTLPGWPISETYELRPGHILFVTDDFERLWLRYAFTGDSLTLQLVHFDTGCRCPAGRMREQLYWATALGTMPFHRVPAPAAGGGTE